ncbi:hypothetical protein [Candidatus Villigracilis affinis]|uniref:hypothetical protein n=1 Tax=Candidatus Villigracilis affinis TaxID=3140682 RepID=UPI001DB0E9BE|nr:hypothetical protein [Anaerolineales bacterium]
MIHWITKNSPGGDTSTAKYYYDNEQETLIEESKGKKKALGCGKIVVKAAYKSANKKQGERFEITVELTPTQRITRSFLSGEAEQSGDADFMESSGTSLKRTTQQFYKPT